jgi:hypothetical protein
MSLTVRVRSESNVHRLSPGLAKESLLLGVCAIKTTHSVILVAPEMATRR